MISKPHGMASDPESDPFGERIAPSTRKGLQLMGGRFDFDSNSPGLLQLVDAAYAGLPAHRFSAGSPHFRVRLTMSPIETGKQAGDRLVRSTHQAPSLSMIQGAGFLGSATATSTFVVLSPAERTALISVSSRMLRFPYHVRYELIEFAVFTLASRAQGLVPLHAACVGLGGRGMLLMGPTGAGKSTLALQCLLEGFDFLAEDSVFVAPDSMRATGTANFLHVRADSLGWLAPAARNLIRSSPIIRRRSGIKKYEVDLRRQEFKLAKRPLEIVGVAFLSERAGGAGPLLRRLSAADTHARLKREQAYGAGLPQWRGFCRNLLRLGGCEILRGSHPAAGAEAVRSLLRGEITSRPSRA
jgi:hypothetical protein